MVSLIDKYIKNGQILNTVEDYPRTKQAELFRRILPKTAGSANSIDGYDAWVSYVLPENIAKQNFTSDDGVEISFTNVILHKPSYVVNGRVEILYPEYCRKYKFPYTGKLMATCIAKKGADIKHTEVHIADIPVMLKSQWCNLYGKTPEELVELGECISDPYGYFILLSERSVITHDKLRCSIPIIYRTKSEPTPVVKETYMVNKIVQLIISKGANSIELQDRRFNVEKEAKTFPIFIIFKVMMDVEPDEFTEKYLFRFIPERFQESAKYALGDSKFSYGNIKDPYKYVFEERLLYKDKQNLKISRQEMIKMVSDDLNGDIYENYNDIADKARRNELKLLSLARLVAKFVLFMIGEIELDSRDYWKVKRFESAPVLLASLVDKIFITAIKTTKKMKESGNKSDYFTFGEVLNSKSKGIFSTFIGSSFNTAKWGVRSYGFERENHAESTTKDTPLAAWSQSVKNTNNTDTNGATVVEVRFLQSSQRNRHCIIETPEGRNVGIVKYNCMTGIFSIQRDPVSIINFLEEFGREYDSSRGYSILVFVNGNAHSYVKKEFRGDLIEKRRAGLIPLDTEITYEKIYSTIQIFTDSSRPMCPYLIVNRETRNLVIDEIEGGWDMEYEELLVNGCMELLSAAEEDDEDILVCKSVEHFRDVNSGENETEKFLKITNYSHCCVDPLQVYSVSSSTCPMSNHQPPPRSTYQAAMGKQALGYYNINYHLKAAKFKRLDKAERSFTETDAYFLPKMDLLPSGQIANVAVMCESDNQEDAIVLNEDYVKSGCLTNIKYQLVDDVINNSTKGFIVKFKIPSILRNEDPRIYRHLNEDGMPKLDSFIEPGDCIIGKVRITPDGEKNESVVADMDATGYVMYVKIVREKGGRNPLIRIMLSNGRKYEAGDKVALRYAQKGTVGRVAKREEFPIVVSGPNKGMRPDILFNPIGFPKRQTAGLISEGLKTKAAIYNCKRVDLSAFRKNESAEAQQTLRDYGMDENGLEEMETSDGKKMEHKVFFVPLYYQALKHHVKDKIQFRSFGPRDFKTRQPQGGRVRGSGLRTGEMEKDVFAAHGVASIIQERMMISSDEFMIIVCGNCGSIIDNKICTGCLDSKPGKLVIPYVFKVFIHLLMGMNMDIRLKTSIGRSV